MSAKPKKTKGSSGGRKKSGKPNVHTLKLKELLNTYESKCTLGEWKVNMKLKDQIKSSISKDIVLTKFVIDESEGSSIVPFIQAVRKCWYKYLNELYLYNLCIPYEQMAVISDFLEQPSYLLNYLEMFGCHIHPYTFKRLSKGLKMKKSLTSLVLDHTILKEEGLQYLKEGLSETRTLLKLSLCYCQLEKSCGNLLSDMVCTSSIAELYVDCNMLECEGFVNLIQKLAENAEIEKLQELNAALEEEKEKQIINTAVSGLHDNDAVSGLHGNDDKETQSIITLNRMSQAATVVERTNSSKMKSPKKRKKSSKKNAPRLPPKVGAFLRILHARNNGIDQMSCNGDNATENENNNALSPFDAMRLLRQWISNDRDVCEINLEDNLITELGAREIISGLEERKEAGYPSLNLKVTHRVSATSFKRIAILASGQKKSKKSKKKKSAGKVVRK